MRLPLCRVWFNKYDSVSKCPKLLEDEMPLMTLLVVLLLAGCAAQQSSDGSSMEVSAVLRSVHRCSRISPEIEVYNPPAGTVSFDVRLEERGNPRSMHGGGTWKNDGSGVIPEGALMRHYQGACPPAGVSRSYQYVVTALDVNNEPLAVRHYIFEQE